MEEEIHDNGENILNGNQHPSSPINVSEELKEPSTLPPC